MCVFSVWQPSLNLYDFNLASGHQSEVGCGCMTQSTEHKNMVNVITWARKKKMSHGDVTSAFEQTVGNNCKKTPSLRKIMLLPPIPVSVSTQNHSQYMVSFSWNMGRQYHQLLSLRGKSISCVLNGLMSSPDSHRLVLYYSSPYTGHASVENPGIIRSTKHQRLFGELQRATLCLRWAVPRRIQNLINIFMLLVL